MAPFVGVIDLLSDIQGVPETQDLFRDLSLKQKLETQIKALEVDRDEIRLTSPPTRRRRPVPQAPSLFRNRRHL